MRRFPDNHEPRFRLWVPRLTVAFACLIASITINAAENPILRVLANEDTGDIKLKAENGDPVAQEKLAGRLEGGRYYAEAAAWYLKAAEAGRAESQYRLGNLLLNGRPQMGADKPALAAQPGTAIGWLTKAAGQNHGQAQLLLGQCYLDGTGVAQNKVLAYKWFILAAEETIVASSSRDRLALTLTTAQIEEGKRLAARFKAGVRSESRIQIVTQAEPVAPVAPAPVNRPGLTRAFAQFIKAQQQAVADETLSALRTDRLAPIKRSLVILTIVGIVAVSIRIALAVLWRPTRRRRRAAPPASAPRASPTFPTAGLSPTDCERLQGIDWFQFEKLMALLFVREGYQVDRRGGAVPDGGVDLELSRDGVRTAVQCKHWRNQQVGVKEVREFLGAMTAGKFDRGMFVTINRYTTEAATLAAQNRIELVGGTAVLALLEKHHAKYDPELAAALDGADKRCPKCEARLVRREAKRGANAGGWFWGCSTFPRCQFVLKG